MKCETTAVDRLSSRETAYLTIASHPTEPCFCSSATLAQDSAPFPQRYRKGIKDTHKLGRRWEYRSGSNF